MGKNLQTVTDGLTYLGDVRFIVVNYTLLVLTVLPFLVRGGVRDKAWLLTFVSVTILQVFIWFSADAVGISVVWAAMAGYNFLTYRKSALIKGNVKRLLLTSVAFSVVAIIYYAFTLPPESTIGHTAAVLIGMGLYYLYNWILQRKS